jgi:hypothetical protein
LRGAEEGGDEGGFVRKLSLIGLLLCLGCGGTGGFSIGGSGSSDQNHNSGTSGSFDQLEYKGAISGGPNDGVLAISIDKPNAALILVLPLQLNSFILPAEGTIPALPGAKFETYKDSQGKSYFALSVPLRYVLKGATFLPPGRLPNGDLLPQIPSGELPSVAVSIPGKNDVKFNVYLGVNVVGVFISSPFDPYLPLHFPIRNGTRDVGYFHSIPKVGDFNGGFFLATTLPTEVAAAIDDHFRF